MGQFSIRAVRVRALGLTMLNKELMNTRHRCCGSEVCASKCGFPQGARGKWVALRTVRRIRDGRGIVNGEALLSGKLNGERLELAAGGDWTADNAAALDQLVSAATPATNSIRNVDIDMGGIGRLDTYGAWLLERILRSATRERRAGARAAAARTFPHLGRNGTQHVRPDRGGEGRQQSHRLCAGDRRPQHARGVHLVRS